MSDSIRNNNLSDRIFALSVVSALIIVIASIIIGSQYYAQRNAAIKTALTSYQLTAKDTDYFIASKERHATEIAESLAKYPDLKIDLRNSAKIIELFSNAMLSNPAFYNIYLGFPNGDFYEVVSLNNNPAMRDYLNANENDHWVVSHVFDQNGKRVRQLDFLDNHLQLRATRFEPSNYDARTRPWFSDAQSDVVTKTTPYIFRFPQIPGQTYAIKLSGEDTVLGIDIPLQALSTYLTRQPLSREGEVYLYKGSGEIIATNRSDEDDNRLPPLARLKLSAADRTYIDGLGSVKISNEQDWPPLDFAVAGEPQGYTVEVLKMAAEVLGLQIEFINGYTWAQLLERFNQDKIDIIQPIARNREIQNKGYFSTPIANLPVGMAFRDSDDPVDNLEAMHGKTLAIPKGWSSIQAIHTAFPGIKILETSSSKTALEAVRDGKADATLDAAVILHYMANRYFIDGLSYAEPVDIGKADIPRNYYFLVSNRMKELGPLIELAIKSLDRPHKDYLRHKWLSIDATSEDKKIMTVPYQELINPSNQPDLLENAQLFNSHGEDYLSYVHQLDSHNKNSDYFAVVVPAKNILGNAMNTMLHSSLLALGCLILLLPFTWFFGEKIAPVFRRILPL